MPTEMYYNFSLMWKIHFDHSFYLTALMWKLISKFVTAFTFTIRMYYKKTSNTNISFTFYLLSHVFLYLSLLQYWVLQNQFVIYLCKPPTAAEPLVYGGPLCINEDATLIRWRDDDEKRERWIRTKGKDRNKVIKSVRRETEGMRFKGKKRREG